MSRLSLVLAACAALVLPVALPIAAHAATPAAASAHDPAKVAVVEQIMTNLKIVDVMKAGAEQGTRAQEANLPEADMQQLISLLDDELDKRRSDLVHAIAADNCDRFTLDQLGNILTLSKIKYVQDMVMHGADPSTPLPDAASMTADEQKTVDTLGNEAYVGDFLQNANVDASTPIIAQATVTAFSRFQALKGNK